MKKEIKVNLTKISVAIAAVIAILVGFIFASNNGAKTESKKLAEINKAEALRTASYHEVQPEEEVVTGTDDKVKFSAYFVLLEIKISPVLMPVLDSSALNVKVPFSV